MKKILIALLALFCFLGARAQETYMFAYRDTCNLYLDIWRPAEGSETTFQGIQKPTILHVFGGGFVGGSRNADYFINWIHLLNKEGYTVVTVDYRLGMNGYKIGKGLSGMNKAAKRFYLSQEIGVEDVFSAITFLGTYDLVDINNLVLAGSSAGAIICLDAMYKLANGTAKGLPKGFTPKGVMSFAGAIISVKGAPKFKNAPCPVVLFHGTDDQLVAYDHFGVLGKGLWGSAFLADQFAQKGYPYCFYRIQDRTHDVASYHSVRWEWEKQFLEQNIMLGQPCNVDTVLQDESFPVWTALNLMDVYTK